MITRAQLDNAQATDRAARAEVNAAEAALIQARKPTAMPVSSPLRRGGDQAAGGAGETVAPGTPLLSGFSLGELRVELELPQSALALAGQPSDVQVLLPGGKAVTPVKLTRFNYADSQSHSFRLRLDLPPNTAGVLPACGSRCSSNRVSVRCCKCRSPPCCGRGSSTASTSKGGGLGPDPGAGRPLRGWAVRGPGGSQGR